MKRQKIDSNSEKPREKSLLQIILEADEQNRPANQTATRENSGFCADVWDDTDPPTCTDEPPRVRKRTPRRTARKVRTAKYYTDKDYRDWARLYDPDQQSKQYNRKRGLL